LLVALYERKKEVVEELSSKLSPEERKEALRDGHAKRRPRPCGITVHTGIGCDYACKYCYIYDMGFPAKVSPYPLSALQLVFALASNPYVVPMRTFAAYGSVTEPFHPVTSRRAAEYIVEVYRHLSLPSQVSTKGVIDEEVIKMLGVGDPKLNILVTVVTIYRAAALEPRAPPPKARLESASRAAKAGFPLYLFVRPIIPGVTDREFKEILEAAESYGIRGLVLGTFRATRSNLERMSAVIDIAEIRARLPRTPRGSEQVNIRGEDLKKKLAEEAVKSGFKVFSTACEANVYAHDEWCAMCPFGPCGNRSRIIPLKEKDVADFLEYRGFKGSCVEGVEVLETRVSIALRGQCAEKLSESDRVFISTAARRMLNVFKV